MALPLLLMAVLLMGKGVNGATSVYSTTAGCPAPASGYTRSVNLAMDGSELPGLYGTLARAVSACDLRADCLGISAAKNATEFRLKSSSPAPSRVEPGSCLYGKIFPLVSSCMELSGYTAMPDAVSTGDAIGGAYQSLTLARKACEANVNCQAVARSGSTISLVLSAFPMAYTRGSCVYVKLPTECSTYNGYTPTPDREIQAAAASTKANARAAFDFCMRDQTCTGFSSSGAVRSTSSGALVYARGKCYHAKATGSTRCLTIDGYATLPDTDMWGSTLSASANAAAAAAACDQGVNCAGFTSYQWRLRSLGTLRYLFGNCFYAKPTSLSPPPPPPDIDECAAPTSPCGGSSNCVNQVSGYRCDCPAQSTYSQAAGDCVDIDECAAPTTPCGGSSNCVNQEPGYKCDCPAQSTYSQAVGDCVDIDECAAPASPCGGLSNCVNLQPGYRCECPAQSTYSQAAGDCVDIDECAAPTSPCGGSSNCVNQEPGYKCECPAQSTYSQAVGDCVDINECAASASPCGGSSNCVNQEPGYKCECPAQSTYSQAVGDCVDTDECAAPASPCGGSSECVNQQPGFKCQCPTQFSYNETLGDCVADLYALRIVPFDPEIPEKGIVQIAWKGEWGSICNVGANVSDGAGFTYGDRLANLVCVTLGYPSGAVVPDPTNAGPAATGPIWLSGLQCGAYDLSIESCGGAEAASFGNTDASCNHSADVAVQCMHAV